MTFLFPVKGTSRRVFFCSDICTMLTREGCLTISKGRGLENSVMKAFVSAKASPEIELLPSTTNTMSSKFWHVGCCAYKHEASTASTNKSTPFI